VDAHLAMAVDKLPNLRGVMSREIICDNVDLLTLEKAVDDLFNKRDKLGFDKASLAKISDEKLVIVYSLHLNFEEGASISLGRKRGTGQGTGQIRVCCPNICEIM
jgi:hypothetical protein